MLFSDEEVQWRIGQHINRTADPSPEDRLLGLEDLRQHMPRFSFDGLKAVRKAQLAELLPDRVSVEEILEALLMASEVGKNVAEKLIERRGVHPPPDAIPENADERPTGGKTNGEIGRIA